MVLDIGPDTAKRYAEMIAQAGTVVWNGPVGVFEFDAFGKGTETLAHAIAESKAFSIAGGGDTLAAVDKYGIGAELSRSEERRVGESVSVRVYLGGRRIHKKKKKR